MKMTLIKYRTPDTTYNQFAVIPAIWLSDIIHWLTISESARIVSTDNDCDNDAILPMDWPSYETCLDSIRISNLLQHAR